MLMQGEPKLLKDRVQLGVLRRKRFAARFANAVFRPEGRHDPKHARKYGLLPAGIYTAFAVSPGSKTLIALHPIQAPV